MTDQDCKSIEEMIVSDNADHEAIKKHTGQCPSCRELYSAVCLMKKHGESLRQRDMSPEMIAETRSLAAAAYQQRRPPVIRFPSALKPFIAAASVAGILLMAGLAIYMRGSQDSGDGVQIAAAEELDIDAEIEVSRYQVEYELRQFYMKHMPSSGRDEALPASKHIRNAIGRYRTQIESELGMKGTDA